MTKEEIETLQTELAGLKAQAETLTKAADLRAAQDKELAKLDGIKEGSVHRALQGDRATVAADLADKVAAGSKDPLADLTKEYDRYAALFGAPAKAEDKGASPASIAAAAPATQPAPYSKTPQGPLQDVFNGLRQTYAAGLQLD